MRFRVKVRVRHIIGQGFNVDGVAIVAGGCGVEMESTSFSGSCLFTLKPCSDIQSINHYFLIMTSNVRHFTFLYVITRTSVNMHRAFLAFKQIVAVYCVISEWAFTHHPQVLHHP